MRREKVYEKKKNDFGRGVLIIADIALQSGKNVAQSQAYGPEARGGLCKAEVVISSEKIGYTKVINPTFLLALTQESKQRRLVRPRGRQYLFSRVWSRRFRENGVIRAIFGGF